VQVSNLIEGMVRLPVDHPFVLRAGADRFALLQIANRDLDLIRHAILDLWAASKPVDRAAVSHHLLAAGLESAAGVVLRWPPPAATRKRGDHPAPGPQGQGAPVVEDGPPEPEARDIEAEWMAFLSLAMSVPHVKDDVEKARNADLDNDDDAFRAAMAALEAQRNLTEAAMTRGRDEFEAAGPEDQAA
jgi:hypothetical protein